jgi:hypothetical protein
MNRAFVYLAVGTGGILALLQLYEGLSDLVSEGYEFWFLNAVTGASLLAYCLFAIYRAFGSINKVWYPPLFIGTYIGLFFLIRLSFGSGKVRMLAEGNDMAWYLSTLVVIGIFVAGGLYVSLRPNKVLKKTPATKSVASVGTAHKARRPLAKRYA